MDNALKFGFYAALIGAVVYFVQQASAKASEWAQAITFKISDFELPTYTGGKLAVPLRVAITNSSPLVAPIENVLIKLSILRNNAFVEFGQVNSGSFTLKPGTVSQRFLPVIDVAKLNPLSASGNLLSNISQVLTNQNALADIKIDTVVVIEGLALPTQTERKQIYLKQLLAA